KKKPRAHLLVDDAGILADPAHTRILREYALHDGPGVDITAGFNLRDRLAQRSFYLLQAAQHCIVIILAAPGIARDPTPFRIPDLSGVRVIGVVVDGAHDHALRPGRYSRKRRPLQGATIIPRFHVLHLARMSRGDPFRETLQFARIRRGSDPRQIESRGASGSLHNGLDVLRSVHGRFSRGRRRRWEGTATRQASSLLRCSICGKECPTPASLRGWSASGYRSSAGPPDRSWLPDSTDPQGSSASPAGWCSDPR